ncbi:MAG: hypothetical protein L0387_24190 [Acidobacteria bacterium]|nr:hypothetical protein [Acidobacteriota bacterium]MCI0624707.1 hypothetical protein [Acidobacteriota bacterium]MCI0717908.1 hypothetical protein [Acidobacteriota bacterium]
MKVRAGVWAGDSRKVVVNEIIVTGQAGSTRNLPLNEQAVRARAEAHA